MRRVRSSARVATATAVSALTKRAKKRGFVGVDATVVTATLALAQTQRKCVNRPEGFVSITCNIILNRNLLVIFKYHPKLCRV